MHLSDDERTVIYLDATDFQSKCFSDATDESSIQQCRWIVMYFRHFGRNDLVQPLSSIPSAPFSNSIL